MNEINNKYLKKKKMARIGQYPWEHMNYTKTFDAAAIRRGFEVYRQVCSSCHSLKRMSFRHFINVSHTEQEIKNIAEEYEIEDGPDDKGEMFMRPGICIYMYMYVYLYVYNACIHIYACMYVCVHMYRNMHLQSNSLLLSSFCTSAFHFPFTNETIGAMRFIFFCNSSVGKWEYWKLSSNRDISF